MIVALTPGGMRTLNAVGSAAGVDVDVVSGDDTASEAHGVVVEVGRCAARVEVGKQPVRVVVRTGGQKVDRVEVVVPPHQAASCRVGPAVAASLWRVRSVVLMIGGLPWE